MACCGARRRSRPSTTQCLQRVVATDDDELVSLGDALLARRVDEDLAAAPQGEGRDPELALQVELAERATDERRRRPDLLDPEARGDVEVVENVRHVERMGQAQ